MTNEMLKKTVQEKVVQAYKDGSQKSQNDLKQYFNEIHDFSEKESTDSLKNLIVDICKQCNTLRKDEKEEYNKYAAIAIRQLIENSVSRGWKSHGIQKKQLELVSEVSTALYTESDKNGVRYADSSHIENALAFHKNLAAIGK